ncbi:MULTISPECIES: carbamoyltransferase family protein [Paraburkholderia]|uniref:Carbamoyltransferase n=1 Tax=Paraburkholderia terricola TaxID=169427 RepID=A0A1M6K870_9BURK|nr:MULTISPECIES: carbamoyltransferase [Paraburkholderia]AXE95985.1 carbamoyltransferase [Paraburkholderia terricola]ORC51540.1 carbamoyltransferase [Burkholderia sp. A27]SDN71961.1 carbamoyltransferase [Paraburkholderia sediminicola]SHJ55181.1 carbamoyltransferase [Paraburkholderia terricola]
MSIIVGVSAHYHDAACCIIKDGKLIAAAEEERFSKVKHDSSIPTGAFRYCLREANATIDDVDCIAYYEDPYKKASRQIATNVLDLLQNPKRRFRIDPARPERDIRQSLGFNGRIEYVDHHLSHAASAFFYSGFADAALLTVDGVGEWATTTYGRGADAHIELFEEVSFPDSLGLLYSTITAYLGFDVNDAEYKVMGLAPYGRPLYVEQMRRLLDVNERGQYRLNMEYFDFLNGERMYSERLPELFGAAPREAESELGVFHKDLAASLQRTLEDILLEKARYLHDAVPVENLCMAGGVALNCVANGRIQREGPFARLFVQPAASDAGGSLGAAAVAHTRLTGRRPELKALPHVYLGPAYSNAEIRQTVRAIFPDTSIVDCTGRPEELIAQTAQRLADGKVIGWFQGRMEFGPRALGSRSIIADPRRPEMRDRINALVKMREAFRPFAPAVLEDKAAEHFELDHPSPFMLETCQVISPLSLPAITHVDGSARVQTVSEQSNPRFHALLAEFDRLTGCPILLNTSFNMRGDAIVLDPVDAVWCFVVSDIDALVIGDYIVDRGFKLETWNKLKEIFTARAAKKRVAPESVNVYTFL